MKNASHHHSMIDNELDICGLFRKLCLGKFWIMGGAVLFALCALIYSLVVRQEWSATAITDRPTINQLGRYYTQQQFLRNQDIPANGERPNGPSIIDGAYDEFVRQLAAYDTRRAFWLQSPYYQQHRENDVKADAALLDKLINTIQFTPADAAKNLQDTTRLVAETSPDANVLLREYVNFARVRAVQHLNDELTGTWAALKQQTQFRADRQKAVAQARFERKVKNTEAALSIAQQQNIDHAVTDVAVDELPDSDMFMLGRPLLQSRLENLQAVGPEPDRDYDKNSVILNTLKCAPEMDTDFQTYRYLRTPENPVKRDSPRRVFLMVMWGIVGMLAGVGVALMRRPKVQ